MEDEQGACNFFKEPMTINDLFTTGSTFQIDATFNGEYANEIHDELDMGSDDENNKENIDQSQLVSPYTKPFNELKQHMRQVHDYIWKNITKKADASSPPVPKNARVCIGYSAYWEGESAPFDSSFLREDSYSFYTGRNAVLEGLEMAVCTMRKGEHAQFLISYHLLFHELGCPPRIKPKADGLFIIELRDFREIGNLNAEQVIPEEDRNKYHIVMPKIRDIHLKGLDFFKQGMYRNACGAFEKALDLLKFCELRSEEEQKDQKELLLKLYTNLAVCYNKTNAPAKTCIMCSEIRDLTNNRSPCKAIFQEGRALLMLGDYSAAGKLLVQAQRMEPQNVCISKELKLLEERFKKYKEDARRIWSKAFGLANQSGEKPDQITKKYDDDMRSIEKELKQVMISFKEDEKISDMKLPSGFNLKEIETLNALAKSLDLRLKLNPLVENEYILTKKK